MKNVSLYFQKLEDICERVKDDKHITAMAKDEASSAYIPVRVREIIQEVMGSGSWEQTRLASTLSQDNSKLLKELHDAQVLLNESRKDCHEIGLKYISVSEKVGSFKRRQKQTEDWTLNSCFNIHYLEKQ